ncbi:hypothetical protein Pan44_13180 [Caulifigura coniformis]|uniref:Uncharacterized protein n=2 Tax=Caulifigura coniformis TaxID=2527983 RepID=A0A517SB03_9PLAN|nr:hypothetical protein Pan44_13180 [Caulifigura coniformis]
MSRKNWKRCGLLAAMALAATYFVVVLNSVSFWPNREPFLAEVPIQESARRVRLLRLGEGPLRYAAKDPRPEFVRRISPTFVRRIPRDREVDVGGMMPVGIFDRFRMDEVPAAHLLLRAVDSNGDYVVDSTLGRKQIELIDSKGFSFLSNKVDSGRRRGGLELERWTCVPRRDEELRIGLFDRNPGVAPIEMTIRNPFFKTDTPVWMGSPLPQSQYMEGTKVTLEGLSFGVLGLQARVRAEGLAWKSSDVSNWFEDATGNRGLWLSPDEPAWKVHVRIRPFTSASVQEGAMVQLPPIEQPKGEEPVRLNQTISIGGTEIQLVEVSLPKSVAQEGQQSSRPSGHLVFKAHARFKHGPYSVFFRRVGDRRLDSAIHIQTGDRQNRESHIVASVTRPENNAPVMVELGVVADRELTFLVTPPEEFKTAMREHVVQSRLGKPQKQRE